MIHEWMFKKLISYALTHDADLYVGGRERPYMRRWRLLVGPKWLGKIYLHCFMRDDDDRALHDHMYASVSWILHNGYVEHTIAQGGVNHRRYYKAGSVIVRTSGKLAHRIELVDSGFGKPEQSKVHCWTLFFCGPQYREWGFHCPNRGWVHWQTFMGAGGTYASVGGPGCGDDDEETLTKAERLFGDHPPEYDRIAEYIKRKHAT